MRYEQNFAIIARRMVTTIAREIEVAAKFVDALCLYLRLPSMSWAPVPVPVCDSSRVVDQSGLSRWQAWALAMHTASIGANHGSVGSTGNSNFGSARLDTGSSDTRMRGLKLTQKRCPAKRISQG